MQALFEDLDRLRAESSSLYREGQKMTDSLQKQIDSLLSMAKDAQAGVFPWAIVSLSVAALVVENKAPHLLDVFPDKVKADLLEAVEHYNQYGNFSIYSSGGEADQTELIRDFIEVMKLSH
ncbi:hypothetical protein [Pseudomonas sp. CGJS7]|uniref:hypothetical protein n=1 Tax=Pseudomonas sp. CGJS7 TaxID=3109348 RepID=UPI00300B277D